MSSKKKAAAPAKQAKASKVPALRADQIVKRLRIPSEFEIKTPADYIAAAGRLKLIKGATKEIRADLKSVVDPIMVGVNRLKAIAARSLDQLEADEKVHKEKIAAFDDAQKALQAKQQQRLDDQASRKRDKVEAQIEQTHAQAKETAKALRKQAAEVAKSGDKAGARELRAQAQTIEDAALERVEKLEDKAASIVAPIVQLESPKVDGVDTRKLWKFEVTDPSKVKAAFMCPDLVKIGKTVSQLGPDAAPFLGEGVRVYRETIVASEAA